MRANLTPTPTIDASVIRFCRRRRSYVGAFDGTVLLADTDLYLLCEDMVDEGTAPAPIRARVAELGFLPAALAADVATWLADQPLAEPTFSRRVPRCRRCHRELTDPESIALGIGPECRKVVAA